MIKQLNLCCISIEVFLNFKCMKTSRIKLISVISLSLAALLSFYIFKLNFSTENFNLKMICSGVASVIFATLSFFFWRQKEH